MTPIDYTLGVTSPLMSGPRVLAAQRVLNGNNVFGTDYLYGPVDGQFGELTGRACIRAKYWLGYPTAELTATYGVHLDAFLHGLQRPDAAMLRRTKIREEREQKIPVRVKALNEARSHLGYRENPAGSNRTRFGKWYGLDGNPWCAMFVTWCYVQAGSTAFVRGSRYAYGPYVVQDARAGRYGLSVTQSPRQGDMVCYDWDGGVADHIGLFLTGTAMSFDAIEGNTAVGNDSNGGQVMRRERHGRQVECFVRVGR